MSSAAFADLQNVRDLSNSTRDSRHPSEGALAQQELTGESGPGYRGRKCRSWGACIGDWSCGRGYRTMKGSTAPVVTTVVPNVTVTETPLAPFIAAVVFTLSWNCFEIGS